MLSFEYQCTEHLTKLAVSVVESTYFQPTKKKSGTLLKRLACECSELKKGVAHLVTVIVVAAVILFSNLCDGQLDFIGF